MSSSPALRDLSDLRLFRSSFKGLADTDISRAAVNNESGGVYDPSSQMFCH